MKKTLTAIVIGCIALSMIITSCKKKETEDPYVPPVIAPYYGPVYSTSLSGLGSHGGVPSGTPYVLPSNVKIIGAVYGGVYGGKSGQNVDKSLANLDYYLSHKPKTNWAEYGYGTYVDVYAKLKNISSSAYNLIVPAGLIMCREYPGDTIVTDSTQSGLVIVSDTITIPAGDTVGVCLKSFCLNAHYGVPYGNLYSLKVVSNNDQLNKVITILKNKKSIAAHLYEIQDILWKISDGTGLTQPDINLMNSWQ